MIKRIIFDIDGTLIAGINFKTNSLKKYLKESNQEEYTNKFIYGIEQYEKKYNSYTKQNYLNHLSNILGIELNEQFLNIFFQELKNAIPKDNKELQKLLKSLPQKYELVILSNYFLESQKNRLDNMQIGQYFIEYYGEKIIKPNNQAYIDACGKHKPQQCIMIGDNINLDIKGAINNGLNAIYINPNQTNNPYHNVPTINSIIELKPETITKASNYTKIKKYH